MTKYIYRKQTAAFKANERRKRRFVKQASFVGKMIMALDGKMARNIDEV